MERNQMTPLRERFIREAEEFLEASLRQERQADDQQQFGPHLPHLETTGEETDPCPLPRFA